MVRLERMRPAPQRGVEVAVEQRKGVRGWIQVALKLQPLKEREDHARLGLGARGAELNGFAEPGRVDQKVGEQGDLPRVPFGDEGAGGVARVGRSFSGDDRVELPRFLELVPPGDVSPQEAEAGCFDALRIRLGDLHLGFPVGQRGEQQGALGSEVSEEGRFGHPDLGRDLPQRAADVAIRAEDGRGDGDDLSPSDFTILVRPAAANAM